MAQISSLLYVTIEPHQKVNIKSTIYITKLSDGRIIFSPNIYTTVQIPENTFIDLIRKVKIKQEVESSLCRNLTQTQVVDLVLFREVSYNSYVDVYISLIREILSQKDNNIDLNRQIIQSQTINIDLNRQIIQSQTINIDLIIELTTNFVSFNVKFYGIKDISINSVTFKFICYYVRDIDLPIHIIDITESTTKMNLNQYIKPVIMVLIKPINNGSITYDMVKDYVSSLAYCSTPVYPDKSNRGKYYNNS